MNEVTVNSIDSLPEEFLLGNNSKKKKKGGDNETTTDFTDFMKEQVKKEREDEEKKRLNELKDECDKIYILYPQIKPKREPRDVDEWIREHGKALAHHLKQQGLKTIKALTTMGIDAFIRICIEFKIPIPEKISKDFLPTIQENIDLFDDEFVEIVKQFPLLSKSDIWQVNFGIKLVKIYKISQLKTMSREAEEAGKPEMKTPDVSKYKNLI